MFVGRTIDPERELGISRLQMRVLDQQVFSDSGDALDNGATYVAAVPVSGRDGGPNVRLHQFYRSQELDPIDIYKIWQNCGT